MKTLDSYWQEAEQLINHFGYTWLLKDDNNIGDVVHALIKAEQDFDGRGYLSGFKRDRARFMMKDLTQKAKKRKCERLREKSYEDKTFTKIVVMDILDKLTPRQGDILYRYYIQSKTTQEIAEDYNLTKQRISQLLDKARKEFKRIYEKENGSKKTTSLI